MTYDQYAVITRAGSGGTTDDEGNYTPSAATTVYNDAVDAQDAGQVVMRDAAGVPTVTSDVTLFLKDESKISSIQEDDIVIITWEDGTTDDARVQRVRRIDGSILCRWA